MTLAEAMRHMEQTVGCTVCLEALHLQLFAMPTLALAPDQYLHHGERCRRFKMSDRFAICVANKNRSVKLAQYGREFYGHCPNGIWDMAYPVLFRSKLAAVFY